MQYRKHIFNYDLHPRHTFQFVLTIGMGVTNHLALFLFHVNDKISVNAWRRLAMQVCGTIGWRDFCHFEFWFSIIWSYL